jgi:hypothetical protein
MTMFIIACHFLTSGNERLRHRRAMAFHLIKLARFYSCYRSEPKPIRSSAVQYKYISISLVPVNFTKQWLCFQNNMLIFNLGVLHN